MSQTEILERIVNYAMSWNGVEEISGNMGWENELFQQMMEKVGWEEGQAWCAYFVAMIMYKIYGNLDYGGDILKNFTGSATQTYENCSQNPRWTTGARGETHGSVVIWRKWDQGQPDWRGHAGIVIEPGAGDKWSHFKSIEGNTNEAGSRIGREVGIKTRINNHGETDGLVVEGFIFPPIPLYKLEPRNIEL